MQNSAGIDPPRVPVTGRDAIKHMGTHMGLRFILPAGTGHDAPPERPRP